MRNLISVIICTHNRRDLIARAIESALIQKECAFEVVVIDDCSIDGTFEYLAECYGSRINLLSTARNSGRAVASNLGVDCSAGNYIALLDDDDYWTDSYKLRKQLDVMESRPLLGVLGTWWVEINGNDIAEEKKPVPPENRYFLIEKLLMGGGIVSGSSPLITREAWEMVGGMDTNQLKGIDSDLYRRIALAGYGVDVLPEITTAADAGHVQGRMTPALTVTGKKAHAIANTQVLWKHLFWYLLYPRALYVRARRVVRAYHDYVSSRIQK